MTSQPLIFKNVHSVHKYYKMSRKKRAIFKSIINNILIRQEAASTFKSLIKKNVKPVKNISGQYYEIEGQRIVNRNIHI